MTRPRTELRIVNIAEDGSEEVIEGINLDMTPGNSDLVAEWGVEYPEASEPLWQPLYAGDDLRLDRDYRGRAYLALHVVAPLIAEPVTGKMYTVRRTSRAT